MRVIVTSHGEKVVSTKFMRMGGRAINAKPALEDVADRMMEILEQVFNSQGRRGGGAWKRVSPEWEARKIRGGLDPRILHATRSLRHSMTYRGDPDQVLVIKSNTLRLGSSLPYAGVQNKERPFANKFTRRDREEFRNIIRDYLMAVWRRRMSRKSA